MPRDQVDSYNGGRRVEIGSETYTLRDLTIRQLMQLEDWTRTRLPNPYDALLERDLEGERRIDRFEADQQKFLMADANQKAAQRDCRLGTMESLQILDSFWGRAHILFLATRKDHPNLTEEDCQEIIAQVYRDGNNRALAMIVRATGFISSDDDPEPEDEAPKAGKAEGETASTSSPPPAA